MDRPVASRHRIVNPGSLPAAVGFAHAVVAAPGRTVYLGGQTGHRADGTLAGEAMIDQFAQAVGNVADALAEAGADPEHLVSLQVFVTDVGEYKAALKMLGEIYRDRFGRHYPAMALFEVSGLFDPGAKVELVGTAVIPD